MLAGPAAAVPLNNPQSWGLLLFFLFSSSICYFLPHHLDGPPLLSLPSTVLGFLQTTNPSTPCPQSHAGKYGVRWPLTSYSLPAWLCEYLLKCSL
jgi:hypothetical protein